MVSLNTGTVLYNERPIPLNWDPCPVQRANVLDSSPSLYTPKLRFWGCSPSKKASIVSSASFLLAAVMAILYLR